MTINLSTNSINYIFFVGKQTVLLKVVKVYVINLNIFLKNINEREVFSKN